MTQMGVPFAMTSPSAKITVPGNWRAKLPLSARRRAGAAVATLLVALVDPAAARNDAQPASSASIAITLSVAPAYELKVSEPAIQAARPGAPDPDGLCLATNSERLSLPVLLVRPSTVELGTEGGLEESSVPLPWCGSGGGSAFEHLAKASDPPELLLIRAE
jgi:hypothetical protein